MLTEKEKETLKLDLKVKFGAYGNMKVIEDTIEATEQALLAKLQPEGVEKIEDELALALSRAEYCPTKEQTDCSIGSNCDRCEAKFVLAKLSPYLLQAKEEERERIAKLIAQMNGLERDVFASGTTEEILQVLSSPVSTEKEGK